MICTPGMKLASGMGPGARKALEGPRGIGSADLDQVRRLRTLRTYCAALAILLAHASAAPALAAAQTDRVAVSAVIEGGCTIMVPRLLAQMLSARRPVGPVCRASRTAPVPQPLVTLTREPGADSDTLAIEF